MGSQVRASLVALVTIFSSPCTCVLPSFSTPWQNTGNRCYWWREVLGAFCFELIVRGAQSPNCLTSWWGSALECITSWWIGKCQSKQSLVKAGSSERWVGLGLLLLKQCSWENYQRELSSVAWELPLHWVNKRPPTRPHLSKIPQELPILPL